MSEKLKKQLLYFFYALFIIALPWQTRWIFFDKTVQGDVWEYGRLGIYCSMLLLLMAALFFVLQKGLKPYFSKDKLFYISFGYFFLISLFSPVPQVSLYYIFLCLLAALFYLLYKTIPKYLSLKIFLFSGLLQSIFALYQFSGQKITANKWLGLASHLPMNLGDSVVEFSGHRILRAYGSFTHPNILGGFLFAIIMVGLYLWLKFYQDRQKEKWKVSLNKTQLFYFLFIITTLAFASFAILATFSRSALLALFFSIFCLLIIYIARSNWLAVNVIGKFVVFFVLISTVFNIWVPGAWQSRLIGDARLETKSSQERVSSLGQFYWQDGSDYLFGQGLGMNSLVTFYERGDKAIYDAQPIHNLFLLVLAEVGILGILLLAVIVFHLWPIFKKSECWFKFLFIGLIVISLFDHYIWTSWLGWFLFVFVLASLKKE